MDDRVLKALAVLFLALAIGAVFGSVQATSRANLVRGPAALIVVDSGDVWLSADRELWRVAPDGALRDTRPIEATGLPGVPANLVHGPDGMVAASVRGDPTLYLMNAASARVVGRLSVQWPPELREHGARAIQFAFDAQGRVAISTGGGHAVALFDPQGAFIARTPPGAYEFTNGLWWAPEGLWTTDTNRFTLRLLDPQTLAERRAVEVGPAAQGSYLGPARGQPGTGGAALLRFRNGMVEGAVSLVDSQGRVRPLPQADLQPADLDWRGGELLMSDSLSSSILRWSAQGRSLAPFGDAALQARLKALADERVELRQQHTRWIVAAVTFLVLGMLCAVAAAGAARRRHSVPRSLDLSKLGTPRPGWRVVMPMMVRAQWPAMAVALPLLALNLVPPRWFASLRGTSLAMLLSAAALLFLLLMVLVWWHARRLRRLARDAAYEPVFNGNALGHLRAQERALGSLLDPGEAVLETFFLQPGRAWWLLSDRRLLRLQPTLTDLRVAESIPLTQITSASTRRGAVAPPNWSLFGRDEASWIEFALADGRSVRGSTGVPPLSARLVARFEPSRKSPRPSAALPPPPSAGRRWRRTLLSLLVPGAGHWLQGRGLEGTALLGLWLALLFFLSGPILWTLVEPYAAVSRASALFAAMIHAVLSALAAIDTWRVDGARAP